jgi:hypothetical protein
MDAVVDDEKYFPIRGEAVTASTAANDETSSFSSFIVSFIKVFMEAVTAIDLILDDDVVNDVLNSIS